MKLYMVNGTWYMLGCVLKKCLTIWPFDLKALRLYILQKGALNRCVLEESLKQGVIYGGPFWTPSFQLVSRWTKQTSQIAMFVNGLCYILPLISLCPKWTQAFSIFILKFNWPQISGILEISITLLALNYAKPDTWFRYVVWWGGRFVSPFSSSMPKSYYSSCASRELPGRLYMIGFHAWPFAMYCPPGR